MTRIAILTGLLALAACGSSNTTGAGGTTGSTTSHASSSATSTSSGAQGCAKPGDAGNAQGVGHYCTLGGGECHQFAGASICLADLGQPEDFCTKIGCMTAADCGAGAGCHIDPAGSACVPCACDDTAVGCGMTSSSSSSSSTSSSSSSGSSSSSASSTSSGG